MSIEDLKKRQEETAASAPTVREALDALQRREAQLVPGAPIRTPRASLLTSEEAQAKHPELHMRFVNIRDPQKAESRKAEGYTRLTSEEGGKQIGDDLVLMGQPKELYEAKVRDLKRQTAERLVAHRQEMQEAAESVARELRDRHGVQVDSRRLLVNEE